MISRIAPFGVLGGAVGSLAAFAAYLVATEFAAAGWAGISTVLASILAWDTWKNHRVKPVKG
jgi:hypothetical protein